jgi:tight adherence protein C
MEAANLLRFVPFVLGGIALLIAIGLVAVAVSRRGEADPIAERLADYIQGDQVMANLEKIEMSVPFTQRVVMPIMQTIAEFTTQFAPQEALQKTAHKLELAGSPSGLTPAILWALRFAMMFGVGITMIMLLAKKGPAFVVLGTLVGGVIGFMMPQMWLQSKIDRRQDEVIKSLPDALDLMTICVEAGLGFDQAMGKVYEKWDNELALAFGRVIQEIALGKTRREALKAMDEGMGVSDVTTFTSAIIQADQLGVSIAKVLKIQSDQMRVKRRQRAQEKAQQAPIKMMIPMVLLIFPTIWLVLLGPAAVTLFKTFFQQ